MKKGYLFSSRVYNGDYSCIGVNLSHGSEKEVMFRQSLQAYLEGQMSQVREERPMVK